MDIWRDSEYIDRRGVLRLELPDRRPRGRPKRRFTEAVKEDMKLVGLRKEDAELKVRRSSGAQTFLAEGTS